MGWNNHMPTEGDYQAIAIQAGAIKVCPFHSEVTINAGDEEASRGAYAIATNKWKANEVSDDREGVLKGIKDAIDLSADVCPACESLRNA